MKQGKKNTITSTEIAIAGAGPIGLELAASLKRAKIDYIQFDAHQIGYTIPVEITPEHVVLAPIGEDGQPVEGKSRKHPADFVLLCTGFVADMGLLETTGVKLQGEERIPEYNPETMETNIPGLYLAGTVAAGRQNRYTLFIENSHQHVGKIVRAITGQWPDQLGTVEVRQYSLPYDDIQTN